MAYGLINADTHNDSQGGILAPISSVMRNRIINGSMTIDQRNAGASITPTNGQFSLDRWLCGLTQASKFTAQQSSTAPVGFSNSLLITSSSAYSVASGDAFYISQAIEGFNTADLNWGTANAKTVTLSFQVYSSLTGTFGGALQNGAQNRSYPFSFTVSSTNTWTTVSITIAGDTSGTWLTTNGAGIRLFFNLGAGSTYLGTVNTWAGSAYFGATGNTSLVGTNGATFYITGVQLEKGSSATGYEYRHIGQEYALCHRYYFQYVTYNSNIDDMYPATTSDTARRKVIQSPVVMRAQPSCVITSSSGTPGYQWQTNLGVQSYVSVGNTTTEVYITSANLSAEL